MSYENGKILVIVKKNQTVHAFLTDFLCILLFFSPCYF